MKPINALLIIFFAFGNYCSFCQSVNKYDLIITEIMSDPKPAVYLPEEEYLEIYNTSDSSIQLANIILHIGNKEVLPDSFLLPPDSFYVFLDAAIPALKNGGDSLKITYKSNIIHKVQYKPSMHSSNFKEDGGWSLELVDFSKPCLMQNNWVSSVNPKGGSPGKTNSVLEDLAIAEISLETHFPINDTTLKLVFDTPIDSLSTAFNFTTKENSVFVKITKLDSNSFQRFTIANPTTCFSHEFEDQTIHYALPYPPNSGDLIINEILFNPGPEGCDYVEVFNPTTKAFDISELQFASIEDDGLLGESYPLYHHQKLLMPQQFMVFCSNPNWVQSQFPNSKNLITTNLPSLNNDMGSLALINKSGQIINQLFYFENWHYPELNDHENVSLEKIISTGNNTSANWTSASSFEGFGTPGYQNSNHETLPNSLQNFNLAYEIVTPNEDGYHDQLLLKYKFPNHNWTGTIDVINASGITIHSITDGALFGTEGVVQWDGYLNDSSVIKPGIYALWISVYNQLSQETNKKKITFYINGKLQ